MAFTLKDLFPASFRGIPFLINSRQSTTANNKLAQYSPPFSNITYAESLGKRGDQINITAVLSGDYLLGKAALKLALDNGEIGILVHPWDGIRTVQCLTYDVVEDFGSIGVVTFNIQFIETVPAINPQITANVLSAINIALDTIDGAMQTKFANNFFVNSYFPSNFEDATSKNSDVSNQFSIFKNQIGQNSNTSNLNSSLQSFSNNNARNIMSPSLLIDGVSDLFLQADAISDDPLLSGNAFVALFQFSNNDRKIPIVPVLSSQAKQRILNRNLVNYTFNAYALIYAYLNFTQATFSNTTQLQNTSNILENQYLKIINGEVVIDDKVNVIDILGADVIGQIEELRNLARIQFDNDSNVTSNIVNIEVNNRTSVSLISYLYYGSTNQDQSIIDLNNLSAPSFTKGSLQTLTVNNDNS